MGLRLASPLPFRWNCRLTFRYRLVLLIVFMIQICMKQGFCSEDERGRSERLAASPDPEISRNDHALVKRIMRQRIRQQLPGLIRQANSGENYSIRAEAIDEMGNAAIKEAQQPLTTLLNSNEPRIRIRAGKALWSLISYPDSELDEIAKDAVIDKLANAYLLSDEHTKEKLAEVLYRCRHADLSLPYIRARMKRGDTTVLKTFISYGSSVRFKRAGTSIEANEAPQILPDDMELLREALSQSYPPSIRISAANIIRRFGKDTTAQLAALREIIKSNVPRNEKMNALDVLHQIGTDDAFRIIEEATNIPGVSEFGNQLILAREAHEREAR